MKKEAIKPLPVVKAYADYFTRRAKRVLGLKRADYKSVSIDFNSRGSVYVYFHGKGKVVASTSFWANGEEWG